MRVASPFDQVLIENIVRHPEVWPLVSADGAKEFDARPYLKPPHVALIVEGGCFLGVAHGYGRYEAHTNFMPTARGRNAITEAKKALMHMFVVTACEEIITKVPAPNRAADWLTRHMGFRLLFERANSWRKNGESWSQRYYSLSIDDWTTQGHCSDIGEAFHAKLETLAPEGRHQSDPVHNAYVGALAALVMSGQVTKGLGLYNRWARFAGYAQIKQVGDHPVRLDIHDHILRIEDGDFAVEEK